MKRYLFLSFVIATVLVFAAVFYRIFFESQEPFPQLAEGFYAGYFSGDIISGQSDRVCFTVEAYSSRSEFKFVVFNSAWGEALLKYRSASPSPLIFSGTEGILRFSGKSDSGNVLQGSVTNIASGRSTEWVLFKVDNRQTADNEEKNVSRLLALQSEMSGLMEQIAGHETLLDKTAKEIARLTTVLASGESLQQKAESRFSEKQTEIEKLRSEIADLEKDLSVMHSSLAVAKTVTQRGRVATLGRESMAREYAQILQKFSADNQADDKMLIEQMKRAQEAIALKRRLDNYKESEGQAAYHRDLN